MGKQRVLWRLGNKHFSSISESTVHIWEGLKQDLSGKLRTIRVGVFKMHAHAHTFYQLTIILLQIALGVNTLAADANEENCMFDIDLWCLCPWWVGQCIQKPLLRNARIQGWGRNTTGPVREVILKVKVWCHFSDPSLLWLKIYLKQRICLDKETKWSKQICMQCWGKLLLKVRHYNIALLPKKVTNYVTFYGK